jgi:ferredoxin
MDEQNQQPVNDQPVNDQPVNDQPVVETPVEEAPVEPVAPVTAPETPVVEEIPTEPEPTPTTPVAEEKPIEPSPAPEVPTTDAPAGDSEDKEMTIGKYKVKIVKHLCIGAASCVAISPNVYELDGENIAVFKEGATDTDENTLAAAQSCPTKAIIITDTETGQQVWPV